MLTFISGWRSADRDTVLYTHRDDTRPTLFFVDDQSTLPMQLPDVPVLDIWRNGRLEINLEPGQTTIIRINYDTDNQLIARVVSLVLMKDIDAQIVVMFDAVNSLYALFPSLRDGDTLLAADSRLDAPEGDHVIFTRGGSFMWTDHMVESHTSLLIGEETFDIGIVDSELTPADY